MSEINVISREQHLIIDTPTRSVNVITGEAPAKDLSVGVPVISGLTVRGTVTTVAPIAGNGTNFLFDAINGVLEKRGTDVEIIDAGVNSTDIRVKVDGLYHISGNVRSDGTTPVAGSLIGFRRNGNAIARHQFSQVNYASIHLATNAYLLRDDILTMFAYSPSVQMSFIPVPLTPIDPYSPHMSVWRVSTTQLVA